MSYFAWCNRAITNKLPKFWLGRIFYGYFETLKHCKLITVWVRISTVILMIKCFQGGIGKAGRIRRAEIHLRRGTSIQ